MQFSQHALFTMATPTNYRIHHGYNCHINERETPKTCLTNHKGSVSDYIKPVVINSFRGGNTNTHTNTRAYSHHGQKQFQETSHALAKGWHAPGLKTYLIRMYFSILVM